ncbi:MAG: phage major capsid protein, partial [Chthoniobacterales bacterium]
METARIDADGKGRAVVRFGKSSLAEEKWQDVQDGILTKVSVGYRIQEVKMTEERDDGNDVFKVTRWEPYEVSLVTAPVDPSVGVGRSQNQEPKPQTFKRSNIMNREQIIALLTKRGITIPDSADDATLSRMLVDSEPKPQKIDVEAERNAGRQTEQERVRSIMETGRKYKKPDLAQKALEEGKSVEEFRQMLLDAVDGDNKAIIDGSKPIGLSEKEARGFSFVKLLRALTDPQNRGFRESAAFEIEACETAGSSSARAVRGTMIPVDVLTTPLQPMEHRATNTVSIKSGAGYTGTGGNTVETRLLSSSFIDLLRNRTVLMRLGSELTGLVGDIDIPKQVGGTTAAWIGEDEDAPKDDVNFGLVQLRNHTLAVYSEITRKMLMQSSIGVEALVRSDLARAMALAVDSAGFYGDGTGNAPVGIAETVGINAVDFVGVQPTFAELVAMETAIALDNADVDSMRYVGNAALRGHAKTTKKFADSEGTL